ncbi:hypothetical protein DLW12_05380 [Escherichia coli]|nr:hypothetical protein [Escherichia coli]
MCSSAPGNAPKSHCAIDVIIAALPEKNSGTAKCPGISFTGHCVVYAQRVRLLITPQSGKSPHRLFRCTEKAG